VESTEERFSFALIIRPSTISPFSEWSPG
jgi:hypothetical protein